MINMQWHRQHRALSQLLYECSQNVHTSQRASLIGSNLSGACVQTGYIYSFKMILSLLSREIFQISLIIHFHIHILCIFPWSTIWIEWHKLSHHLKRSFHSEFKPRNNLNFTAGCLFQYSFHFFLWHTAIAFNLIVIWVQSYILPDKQVVIKFMFSQIPSDYAL